MGSCGLICASANKGRPEKTTKEEKEKGESKKKRPEASLVLLFRILASFLAFFCHRSTYASNKKLLFITLHFSRTIYGKGQMHQREKEEEGKGATAVKGQRENARDRTAR